MPSVFKEQVRDMLIMKIPSTLLIFSFMRVLFNGLFMQVQGQPVPLLTQTMMIGGESVTVLTSGPASQPGECPAGHCWVAADSHVSDGQIMMSGESRWSFKRNSLLIVMGYYK